MTQKYALCVDIGTTSLKAALIDAEGNVGAFSQQFFSNPDSKMAACCWLPALRNATRELTAQTEHTICAICISGNGPTIVSDDGTTLLWNAPISDAVNNSYKNLLKDMRSLFIPRITAFRTLFPSQWNKSRFIYSGPEYLIYTLTKASLTILPEIRYLDTYWSNKELEIAALEKEKLPPYATIAHTAGFTTPDITAQLGLAQQVPVFCGGPDFIAAMIGTNSLSVGTIYDRAGSSEGVNLCAPFPLQKSTIRNLPSVVAGLWNAAVLQSESGRMFMNYKKIAEAVAKRTISYKEIVTYSIANKSSDGFAILEAILHNLKVSIDTLASAAHESNIDIQMPIVITGGQVKNDEWLQMRCNYIGLPFAVCTCADAELLGNAAVSFYGLGVYS